MTTVALCMNTASGLTLGGSGGGHEDIAGVLGEALPLEDTHALSVSHGAQVLQPRAYRVRRRRVNPAADDNG